ncbi:MAG: TetR/AcrR family transcriptional regulator [Candidatus Sericytochromatia bacterium]
MPDAPDKPKQRDAERSRRLLLDAAEALFAQKGFAATSVQEIADRAGLTKGTPLYFFGSKDNLYKSVLDRLFAEAGAAMGAVAAQPPAGAVEDLVDAAVDTYIDFLAARPNFVRLMAREAIDGGLHVHETVGSSSALAAGFELLGPEARAAFRDERLEQVVLSVMAMCVFPFMQADNLVKALHREAYAPAFIAERKAHVKQLIRHGLYR